MRRMVALTRSGASGHGVSARGPRSNVYMAYGETR